jgi:hypothetical protein
LLIRLVKGGRGVVAEEISGADLDGLMADTMKYDNRKDALGSEAAGDRTTFN